MAKFRKKPGVIEAEQYLDGDQIPAGICFGDECGDFGAYAHVHTIHENQRVFVEFGDWIIAEPDGDHYYPVKPDMFAATYEPVAPPQE